MSRRTHSRRDETERATISRDPRTCEASGCDAEATTATPAGGLCPDHADDLADDLRGQGGGA